MTYWQAGWTVVTVALFLVGAFQDRYVGGPMNWGWLGASVFVAAMTLEQFSNQHWRFIS